jgi:hypothetical protein
VHRHFAAILQAFGYARQVGRLLPALAVALALTLAPASDAAVAVTHGTITPNRGAAGIRLGMSRAQVLAKLGAPVYKNANGYLQYAPNGRPEIFDVYLDVAASPDRVRLLGVSGAKFCFPAGFCMFDRGAVGKLKAAYGSALKIVTLEDGERVYRLTGTRGGCQVFTDFTPARFRPGSRILMVFIGYLSGSAC